MSTVNVRSIDSLDQFRAELSRFAADGRESLQRMEIEINNTLEKLDRERRKCEELVRYCQDVHRRAQTALQSCLSQGRDEKYGRGPDCAYEAASARVAEARLHGAEDALQAVQRKIQMVRQAAAAYYQQARRLQQMLETDIPRARSFLGRKVDALRSYAALIMPTGPAFSLPNFTTSPGPVMRASTLTAPQEPPSGASAEPVVAGHNYHDSGTWIERGIRDVPCAQIDLSDSYVHSYADFRKVPHDVMREGVRKLETVVRPAVQQGADGDDFSAFDLRQGLDIEHGYRRIYDAFYGREPVRLRKSGQKYAVESGYHRLSVAAELGLATVPARIIEGDVSGTSMVGDAND